MPKTDGRSKAPAGKTWAQLMLAGRASALQGSPYARNRLPLLALRCRRMCLLEPMSTRCLGSLLWTCLRRMCLGQLRSHLRQQGTHHSIFPELVLWQLSPAKRSGQRQQRQQRREFWLYSTWVGLFLVEMQTLGTSFVPLDHASPHIEHANHRPVHHACVKNRQLLHAQKMLFFSYLVAPCYKRTLVFLDPTAWGCNILVLILWRARSLKQKRGAPIGAPSLFTLQITNWAYARSGGVASVLNSATTSSKPRTRLCLDPKRRIESVRSSISRIPTARITGTLPTECSRTL